MTKYVEVVLRMSESEFTELQSWMQEKHAQVVGKPKEYEVDESRKGKVRIELEIDSMQGWEELQAVVNRIGGRISAIYSSDRNVGSTIRILDAINLLEETGQMYDCGASFEVAAQLIDGTIFVAFKTKKEQTGFQGTACSLQLIRDQLQHSVLHMNMTLHTAMSRLAENDNTNIVIQDYPDYDQAAKWLNWDWRKSEGFPAPLA